MVVIHLKIGNGARGNDVGSTNSRDKSIGGLDDGFLFETTTDTPNDNLIQDLVLVHNLRLVSNALIENVRRLASHGPMKSNDEKNQCPKQQAAFISGSTNDNSNGNYQYKPDPSGRRTGQAPNQTIVDAMEGAIRDLERYIHPEQVQRRICLNLNEMYKLIDNVRGSVTMAYPMGLPEHEMTKQLLNYIASCTPSKPQDAEDNSKNDNSTSDMKTTSFEERLLKRRQQRSSNPTTSASATDKCPISDLLNPDTTALWAAGKEFVRGQFVRDRLGGSRNEKTKLVAKFQALGQGAPGREPIVSQEEQLAMMAYYHKRQEELKRLAESDDDDYLYSSWADPKGLKKNLHQLSDTIKAPGVRRGL